MESLIFPIYVAVLVVLVLIYWAWRFKRRQCGFSAIELPMTGSPGSLLRCQVGDVTFYSEGSVHFGNYDQAFYDGMPIQYQEEHGLKATRASGFGKILHIERPDGIVQMYQYIGCMWYQLVPCEPQPSVIKEAIRQIRQRGITGLITFPEKFANRVLAIPGFISLVAIRIATLLFVLRVILGYFFPGLFEQYPVPVYTSSEQVSESLLITPEVAEDVESLSFLPDNKTLVTIGGPHITWWDAGSLRRKQTEELLVYYPSGRSYVTASPLAGHFACVLDGDVLLWDDAIGWIKRQERAPPAPKANIRTVAFSPDGKLVATAGGDEIFGKVEIFHAHDLSSIAAFDIDRLCVSVAFSHDGSFLAAATTDQRVFVWSVSARRRLATLEPPTNIYQFSDVAECPLAFSPTKNVLVTTTEPGDIHFWDIAKGKHIGSVDLVFRPQSLSYSPDGKLLAALVPSGELGVVIINPVDKKVVATSMPRVPAREALFSPSGEIIAVAGYDRIELLSVAEILAKSNHSIKGS